MGIDPNETVKAKRFEFTLNDQYFVQNIKIDKTCHRVESSSKLQGRVVSKEGIMIGEELDLEDDTGRAQRDISDLSHRIQKFKYYFQFRIDELNENANLNPKICIGVCKENFLVNQDLSR